MAVLGKVNFQSQQRLDLAHVLAEASFTAYDFRAMLQMMNGLEENYVISGLEINGVSGLALSISLKNAMLLCPLDGTVSFYTGTSDDPDEQIIVPPSTSSVFIEAYLERDTQTPVTTAFFDPGATSETNPAGSEFTASVDFQQVVLLKFRFKTDGFSSDAIPVARVSTSATSIDTVTDCRKMFFRLGSGGAVPDPFNRFDWSSLREETSNPGPATSIGKLNGDNPYYSRDADGAKNDKAITNLKQWMDAVTTVIAEIKDTPTWYFPTTGQSIPSLLFLSGNATSIVPVQNRSIQWSADFDSVLRSKGSGAPTTWGQNFGPVRWYVGGTFVSANTRRFNSKDWTVSISEGESLFLLLDREKRPGLVPASQVLWGVEEISPAALLAVPEITRHVKGQEGDFTGVAIGDYVRKEGAVYFEYYRVVGIVEAGFPIVWDPVDVAAENIDSPNWGLIATNACTGLLLERDVDETSVEPFRWFRASYQQEDLFKTASDPHKVQSNSPSPLELPVDDINLYWLGRHSSETGSDIFLFRDYGNMSPGEEFKALDDSDGMLKSINSEVFLDTNVGIQLNGSNVLGTIGSDVFTLRKRKTDNLNDFGVTNGGAWQEYVFSSTATFSNDGDGLWVRLDDNVSISTPLVAGTVNPPEPTVPTLNVFQVLPKTENPLRNFRNTNVFLVCRRINVEGAPALQFFDGTVVRADGIVLRKDITKVVAGVTTSTTATTVVTHNYLRNTTDFIWSARRTSTGRTVMIGGTQDATGVTLDATPAGAESLTVTFTRHIS